MKTDNHRTTHENSAGKIPLDTIVMLFDALALGARFSYPDSDRVWIKLNGQGCGLCAEYDSEMIGHENWRGQNICSVKESKDEKLTVEFVE